MQKNTLMNAIGALFRRRSAPNILAGLFVTGMCALLWTVMEPTTQASTLKPLTPQQIFERAGSVVRGTVVGTRTLSSGTRLERSDSRGAIALPPQGDLPEDFDPSAGEEPEPPIADRAAPQAPVSAGVEGGMMLFTEVTLAIDETVKGERRSEITFVVAGGRNDEYQVTVHGLPEFVVGQEYVLFLEANHASTAEPVVGGDQGFFRVDRSVAGNERLMDASGRVVVGMDPSTFATQPAGPRPRSVPGPIPDDPGVTTSSRMMVQAAPPMFLSDFMAAVRLLDEEGR